jgi:hypothetical protein
VERAPSSGSRPDVCLHWLDRIVDEAMTCGNRAAMFGLYPDTAQRC